jgi:hypothetical protein
MTALTLLSFVQYRISAAIADRACAGGIVKQRVGPRSAC